MKSMMTLINTLEKTDHGPYCSEFDWDNKVLPRAVKDKLKKYGLEKTCVTDNPINCDDDLADTFFKAGYELALELGIYCRDTERIIKVSEEELEASLRYAPSEITLGTGEDEVVLKKRNPEDPHPPLLEASLCITVDEDLYVPMVEGIAKNRHVDILHGPSFATIKGREVRTDTPWETLQGRYEAELRKEALWRAGRPGMPSLAMATTNTEYSNLGGLPALSEGNNIAISLNPPELKTTYGNIHRVVQGINYGLYLRVACSSFIGGYAGPTEGAVLTNIASDLLIPAVLGAHYTGSYIYDTRYFGNIGRNALWANSVSIQAVSRNTNLMRSKIVNENAGPCTEEFLYQAAVGLMNHCVSGAESSIQPRSAAGKYPNHITPVECWWCGEVFKACAGMTRKKANEIANVLIPKYEDRLYDPPKGKSNRECFDFSTFTPTKEYQAIYNKVKQECIDLGIPLNPASSW